MMNIEHWWTLMNIDESWFRWRHILRVSSRCHCVSFGVLSPASGIPRPCCCAISVWWNGPWVSIRKVWSFSKRCQWVKCSWAYTPQNGNLLLGRNGESFVVEEVILINIITIKLIFSPSNMWRLISFTFSCGSLGSDRRPQTSLTNTQCPHKSDFTHKFWAAPSSKSGNSTLFIKVSSY